MGHFIFIVLHLAALLFGAVLLVITIPCHLIYAAVKANRGSAANTDGDAPTVYSHVRCPDCKELVRRDAVKCRHCGLGLVPQPLPATPVSTSNKGLIIVCVGVIVVWLLLR